MKNFQIYTLKDFGGYSSDNINAWNVFIFDLPKIFIFFIFYICTAFFYGDKCTLPHALISQAFSVLLL